ncbi:MAG: hypothetical protein GF401_14925 [Chitinivibrionales bacterium]|nr:hypothetical protein [Chitinivibrionales bacterium]
MRYDMPKFIFTLLIILQSIVCGEYVCDTTIVSSDTMVTCSTWSEKGKPIACDRYMNGELHGKQIEWYEDGTLMSVMHYQKGSITDTSLTYYPDGKLKVRAIQDGFSITLSNEGDTLTLSRMKNGKSHGEAKSFFKNGKKKAICNSKDGKQHGLSQTWREDGTRKDSTVYENGEIVEIREYFLSGSARYWATYSEGAMENADFFTPKGKLSGKVREGTGEYVVYSEDGRVRFFREYKAGKRVSNRKLGPGEEPLGE